MTNFQPWSTRLTFTNINPTTNAAGVPLGASLSNPYNDFVGGAPFPYNGSYATGGGIFGVVAGLRVGARLPDERRRAASAHAGARRSAPPTSGRSTATCRSSAT